MQRCIFACLLTALPLADVGPSCGSRPRPPVRDPKNSGVDKPASPGAGATDKPASTDAKSK